MSLGLKYFPNEIQNGLTLLEKQNTTELEKSLIDSLLIRFRDSGTDVVLEFVMLATIYGILIGNLEDAELSKTAREIFKEIEQNRKDLHKKTVLAAMTAKVHYLTLKINESYEVMLHDTNTKGLETVTKKKDTHLGDFEKPSDLVKALDEYVIGQDHVKKALAMHAFNHYKSILKNDEMKKQNLLIIGETGTGKTYLVDTLARLLNKTVVSCNMGSLTKEGYVGQSLSDVIGQVALAAEQTPGKGDDRLGNVILFLDEFDKLASGLDVVHELQFELLKLLESGQAVAKIGRDNEGINIRPVLIILGGSFTQLIDKKRNKHSKQVGFTKAEKDTKEVDIVTHEDVVKYGIKREIVGRIGNIVQTHALTVADLHRIVKEPKMSIKNYFEILFKDHGLEIEILDSELEYIVEEAVRLKVGARGLWAIAEKLYAEKLYY